MLAVTCMVMRFIIFNQHYFRIQCTAVDDFAAIDDDYVNAIITYNVLLVHFILFFLYL